MKKFFIFCLIIAINFQFFSENVKVKRIDFSNLGSEKESVQKLIKKYTTTHKTWLYQILDEAEFLRIHVRRELEKNNMPFYLEYLPLVESNYNPNAKSKSGALGMWQFMLNSVEPFLECDEFVDERKDPWFSTTAAILKLKDNYKMFNDWPLAITAYNCGAGGLKRILKNAEKKDFWYLVENNLLSEQASSYFQKLIAISEVCENQQYYDVKFPTARNYLGKTKEYSTTDFDYVTVYNSVDLKKIAYEIRLDEKTIFDLNLSLIKGVTPPNRKYSIRLPAKTKKMAEYALENLNYN